MTTLEPPPPPDKNVVVDAVIAVVTAAPACPAVELKIPEAPNAFCEDAVPAVFDAAPFAVNNVYPPDETDC